MYIKTEFGEFEWDEAKAEKNVRKHGIRFDIAIRIFAGDVFTKTIEKNDHGETREISTGLLAGILITTIIHTQRGKARRIISARPADRQERRDFAAFIQGGY